MKKKICLDAGHYGKYNRSPGIPEYYESEMNWKLHLLLKKYLEQYGFQVSTTRSDKDKDMELTARGKASKGCDLFLSLHSNAVGSYMNEKVDYPVVYVPLNGSADDIGKKLADCVTQVMGTTQKGWNGNAWYSGDVYTGGASQDDTTAKKLATEEFVTNALSGVEHPTPDLTGYATEEFVNTAIQQNAYTLPIAMAEAIGGVKVGDTLEISADGALNVKQAETPTELYLMSPGGLKFKITVSDVGELLAEQVV